MKIIKLVVLIFVLIIKSNHLFCQTETESELDHHKGKLVYYQNAIKEIQFLKKMYTSTDTVSHIAILYKDSFFLSQLDTLNNSHPSEFYKKCGEFLQQEQYDKASILLELAFRRYSYFNATNPNYQPSSDGALSISLAYVLSEKIVKYETINFNNYIDILQFCTDWHQTHLYQFNMQNSDTSLYNKITSSLIELKQNKITKKEETIKKSIKEKEDFLKNYNSYNSQLNEIIEITKKKIKELE